MINGEPVSGVTTMQMDEGLDTGDMIMKTEIVLDEKETGGSLHDKLAEAGAKLCVETLKAVEDGTAAVSYTHLIDMVLLSHASMPDRTEAIRTGDDTHLINLLCNDARTLETLGASNIAITCNTSHYFYKHIQNAVKIPVINMIQESVNYAVHKYDNVKRVGIMATDGTIGSKIYHKACRKAGVTPVQPLSLIHI